MHQTRKSSTTRLPIERKGTKYIARASSHLDNSVPILIAIRDMLKLAKTAKEVKQILKDKEIKINGRKINDYHQSIKLFNILEVGKTYQLSLLPTKKFILEEVKGSDSRLCKVVGKKLLKGGKVQLNLHDGSNILTKEKIAINDSVYLDFSGKIKKHIPLEKDKKVLVISGKHEGQKGQIISVAQKKANIQFKEGSAVIDASRVIAL
jgi:small subunit ribosomal protein S4e